MAIDPDIVMDSVSVVRCTYVKTSLLLEAQSTQFCIIEALEDKALHFAFLTDAADD
jgi:hypothetical protein